MNDILLMAETPELAADQLVKAMAEGAAVVTPTRRLARALQEDFARQAQAASWPTPSVLPWSAWLQALFRELRDFGILAQPRPCLDEWQSAAVWEQALAADDVTQQLLMFGGAVESFREAWQLAHEWCLPWPELHARGGDDCHSFLRVAHGYQSRLDELGCLDDSQLPPLLAAKLPELTGPPVIFAGFDRLSPAQQGVFEALGPRARRLMPTRREAGPGLLSFADSRVELAAAADWARRKLDENPSARIAIVVPDLEAQAPMLEALLDAALAPQRLFPGNEQAPRPWNLSLGRPLSEAPVVAAALLALGLARSDMELSELGRLLRSPFLGGASAEGADRARLDRGQPGCVHCRTSGVPAPSQGVRMGRGGDARLARPRLARRHADGQRELADGAGLGRPARHICPARRRDGRNVTRGGCAAATPDSRGAAFPT